MEMLNAGNTGVKPGYSSAKNAFQDIPKRRFAFIKYMQIKGRNFSQEVFLLLHGKRVVRSAENRKGRRRYAFHEPAKITREIKIPRVVAAA